MAESIDWAMRLMVLHTEHLEQQNSAIVDDKDVPEFTVEKQPFRYDLYRIPFNDGKGGTAEPLEGASNNGMSTAAGGRVSTSAGMTGSGTWRMWACTARTTRSREMPFRSAGSNSSSTSSLAGMNVFRP